MCSILILLHSRKNGGITMNTKLGTFYLKTYSIARPNQDIIEKMEQAIDNASNIPLRKARSIARDSSDKSEVEKLAIELIDEGKLEHELFVANGSAERVCLNLKKHTIELTSF